MPTQQEQIAALRADQPLWRQLAAESGPDRYVELGPTGEQLLDADLTSHLHEEHIEPLRAWLDRVGRR